MDFISNNVIRANGRSSKIIMRDQEPPTKQQTLLLALEPHLLQDWRMRLSFQQGQQVMETMVRITPELAQWILDNHNGRNRPINAAKVKKLQNLFEAGRYNPDQPDSTILFGKEDMINGQHRLSACVASGISFVTKVEIGHEDKVLLALDQTEPRTEAQQAAILGRPPEEKGDYAPVKQMWRLENQTRLYPYERGGKAYDLIDNHYPREIWGIVPAKLTKNKRTTFLVAPIRAVLLLLATKWPQEVKEFLRQIRDTEFKCDTGSYQLYHYLNQSNSVSKHKTTYDGQMSMTRLTFRLSSTTWMAVPSGGSLTLLGPMRSCSAGCIPVGRPRTAVSSTESLSSRLENGSSRRFPVTEMASWTKMMRMRSRTDPWVEPEKTLLGPTFVTVS